MIGENFLQNLFKWTGREPILLAILHPEPHKANNKPDPARTRSSHGGKPVVALGRGTHYSNLLPCQTISTIGREHTAMKLGNKLTACVAGAAALAFTAGAFAQGDSTPQDKRWYVAPMLSYGFFDHDSFRLGVPG